MQVVNEIQKVRSVFKFADDNGLIEKRVRFGSEFKKPNRKAMRLHRAKQGRAGESIVVHELGESVALVVGLLGAFGIVLSQDEVPTLLRTRSRTAA